RKLHDELHITSIFVTHDQEEALEVADQVVLMDHGHVEQVGTPDDVYNRPASPFVYGFLGSVNAFHGRSEAGSLIIGDQHLPHEETEVVAGDDAYGFSRPHELQILPDVAGSAGVQARVVRVLSFGVNSRVELDGVGPLEGHHYEVELTPNQLE